MPEHRFRLRRKILSFPLPTIQISGHKKEKEQKASRLAAPKRVLKPKPDT